MTEARRRGRGHERLIVSFGDVTSVRGMATLIEAFELLCVEMPTARLVITGYVEPEARTQTAQLPIEFLGDVAAERYVELLKTADLAVQLRLLSDEQAPMLVADCLAHGLPTVVSDLGWAGELPADVTEKVPSSVSPGGLEDSMLTLLSDRHRLAALSEGAIEYARRNSFARVADAYLDALGLN